jgi:hypothetical protein
VDSASLISSVVSARESTTANQRQIAVAVNAVRTEQATVSTLLEALQQSAAYGSGGQALASGGVGTRFVASA